MDSFDFFESYTFKLLTDTYYYITYENYENAKAITNMELSTMQEWLQKVDTIEDLPQTMQKLVKLVERNHMTTEEEEKEAEEIIQNFLIQKDSKSI